MKHAQALLIVVMLLATVLTVTLTATYQSVTETQVSKLEEENQKALAAAEAGIEKLLQSKQQGTFNFSALGLNFSGIAEGQASTQTSQSNQFITPPLSKDEQYTFYLAPYNPQTKNFTGNSTQQNINVCFGSSAYNPAIEITLIKTNSIKKYAVNPQAENIITNGSSASSPNSSDCPDNNFSNKYTIQGSDIGTDSRLLIVRIIQTTQGQTRIGFKATSSFPLQGTTIVSKAKTAAGIEKKIKLFQSYPQIPSDFFVTSF